MRISWSALLVYSSLLFLGLWLGRSGHLHPYPVIDGYALGLAVALVIAGFLAAAVAWWRLLALNDQPVPLRVALASIGVTIFAKYVPGKVWAIVGRAGYVCERSSYPLSTLSLLSLKAQLITLWIGLPLGALSFVFVADDAWRGLALLVVVLWVLLSVVLLTDSTARGLAYFERWLLKKELAHVQLPAASLLRAIPWFLLVWLAWCMGFALLVAALSGEPPRLADGLAFVLAANVAVLAVIAPGGLGVREGLLVLLLVMLGHPAQFATMVSVIARLWFLAGEVMLFAAGLIAQRGLVRPAARHD